MKKLDRYVWRELLVPFVIGTISVLLMFQANTLIYLLKTFSISNIPPAALAQLILLKTPQFLIMTLPVGMALAASLALSRITRESELTAMRSAGASIGRVMVPVGIFGALVGIGNFLLAEKVMPKAERDSARLMMNIGTLGMAPTFKKDVVVNFGANSTAYIGNVIRGPNDTIDLLDILIFERVRMGEVHVYSAAEGQYDKGVWSFKRTYVRVFRDENMVQFKVKGEHSINEKITVQDFFMQPQPTELTAEQIKHQIEESKMQGRDTTNLQISYYVRYSVPAACFIFALAAPVFAILLGRSGGFVGVLLSILLVFLYYNMYVISTEIFGKNGWLNPFFAAWLTNFVFIAFGIIGLRKLE